METEHPLLSGDGADASEKPERRAGGMRQQALAVKRILTLLEPLPAEGRARVIRAAAALFGVGIP